MGAAAEPSWVMCGRVARRVTRQSVACPRAGHVNAATCLTCRYLMTSSDERGGWSWCELPRPGMSAHAGGLAQRTAASDAELLDRAAFVRADALETEVADQVALRIGGHESVRPARPRPRKAVGLPRGQARARREEARAPALR